MVAAYIAFDLDNTLGYFDITNKLAYLWSPEFIGNPEQSVPNRPNRFSGRLLGKLKRARTLFARSLVEHPHLLSLVLRPNLDAIFLPLLKARRDKAVKSVIIYSNTSVCYSVELAKTLIETVYKCPGLFSLTVDHWSPLRIYDREPDAFREPYVYVEPLKTIGTLQYLFRVATNSPCLVVPLESILFVDDRIPKHELKAQEAGGLTYVVPTRYAPHRFGKTERKEVLDLALDAMDRAGLLEDEEYLNSDFCHRKIPYDWTKLAHIRGFPDLVSYVWMDMEKVKSPERPWERDTVELSAVIRAFFSGLQELKANS